METNGFVQRHLPDGFTRLGDLAACAYMAAATEPELFENLTILERQRWERAVQMICGLVMPHTEHDDSSFMKAVRNDAIGARRNLEKNVAKQLLAEREYLASAYVRESNQADSMIRATAQVMAGMTGGRAKLDELVNIEALHADVEAMLAQIYADTMTVAELEALRNFATSEAGKSVAAKSSAIEAITKPAFSALMDKHIKLHN